MRNLVAAGLLILAGCAAAAPQVPPAAEPAASEPPRAVRLDPPIAGYDPARIREEVERNVADRLGPDALLLARATATSIMVTHHQGMPRPVRNADGSWGYEPPGANAMARGPAGWFGWSGRTPQAVAAAKAAEIDRILADPHFWTEPDYVAPDCTDAGARRIVVRHAGRIAIRQQGCDGAGLTGRLWKLVYDGPG